MTSPTSITVEIDAPIETVFDTVAHIHNYAKAMPHIVHTEVLGDVESGVGMRFRQTRRMGKREATTELEVTEYVPNEHVRMVADSGGAIWDSIFTLRPRDGGTTLTLHMDARAYKLLPKLIIPLFGPLMRKAVHKDMAALKAYCERPTA